VCKKQLAAFLFDCPEMFSYPPMGALLAGRCSAPTSRLCRRDHEAEVSTTQIIVGKFHYCNVSRTVGKKGPPVPGQTRHEVAAAVSKMNAALAAVAKAATASP
jgi:hypothetical protein